MQDISETITLPEGTDHAAAKSELRETLKVLSCLALMLLVLGLARSAFAMSGDENGLQVSLREAEEAVAAVLQTEGVAKRVKATITNTRVPVLYQADRPVEPRLKTLAFDAEERRWSGNVYFMSGEEVLSAMPFSGRYEEVVMIPVLKRRVHHGDVIAAEDIEEKPFLATRLRKDTVLAREQMEGRTVGRVISSGRPVRLGELRSPDAVTKDKTVQMRFSASGMTITTIGEALEPGAIGERIRVRNHDSGKIVRAEIVSADEVVVGARPERMAEGEEKQFSAAR